MNITFMIGNGFDIGLGLKTGYEDFYKEYCISSDNDNENIAKFKEMLRDRNKDDIKKIIDWADFECAFGKHSEDFLITNKDLYIDRFEDFVTKFNSYLEAEESKMDYSNDSLITETMKTAVTTYFHIRRGDRVEVQKTYNSISDKRIYNFISFNYTRSIDNCAQMLAKKLKDDSSRDVGKVVHIHGYVDSNMIMGVNDPAQITNVAFANDIEVVREIVKPQQNTDSRTRYEDETISLINSSHIICIYGMSIGATDAKWWDIISKWLLGNPMRRLVVLKYDEKYNPRFTHVQRRFTDDMVERFLAYSSLAENKREEIKSRIYIGANHNVFSMQLRKNDSDESCKKTICDSKAELVSV